MSRKLLDLHDGLCYIQTMSKQYVIGADPGKHGAIVFLNVDDFSDQIHVPTKVSSATGEIDYVGLYNSLMTFDKGTIIGAAVEQVHAIYGSAAGSTFSFGEAYGSLRATMLIAGDVMHFPVYSVPPKMWQKVAWHGVDKVQYPALSKGKVRVTSKGNIVMETDTKATSSKAAQHLFPAVSFVPPRCKNEHDGLVDAALIAYYAMVSVKAGELMTARPAPKKKRRRKQSAQKS